VRKALWDGVATAKDGSRPYENTYSWFLQVQGEKIVSATAFFDTQACNDFWTRISPNR
jgi:ketosteroid isomerase-like protein